MKYDGDIAQGLVDENWKTKMTKCKHNWIPIWEHKHDYFFQCARCNKITFAIKKETK